MQGAGQRSGKIKECFSGGVVGGLTGGWGCVLEDGKVAHDSVLPDHAKMNGKTGYRDPPCNAPLLDSFIIL